MSERRASAELTTILTTERLLLRTWDPDGDLEAAHRVWGDPAVMSQVDDGIPLPDREATRRSLIAARLAQHRYGVCLWAVVERASGRVIGSCGFHHLDAEPGLELGFHLARDAWGQGYATEAARACVAHALGALRAPRVIAGTYPENAASQRVLEKAGLRAVGPDPLDARCIRYELRAEAPPRASD